MSANTVLDQPEEFAVQQMLNEGPDHTGAYLEAQTSRQREARLDEQAVLRMLEDGSPCR